MRLNKLAFIGISAMLILSYLLAVISLAHAEILSVSKTDLVSNAPELNGKTAWMVLMTAGTSEKIVGKVDANEIKDPDTGATAKHGFQVSIDVNDYQCDYPVRTDINFKNTIYEAHMFQMDKQGYYTSCPNDVWQSCVSKNGAGAPYPKCGVLEHYTKYVVEQYTRFYCIYFKPIAATYPLDTPDQKFSATIQVTRDDGPTEFINISNVGALSPEQSSYYTGSNGVSGKSSDGNIYVRWVGYLSLGKGCPNPANYKAVYSNGEWYTTSTNNVNQYLSKAYDALTNCLSQKGVYIENCVDSYNYYAYLATSKVPIHTVDALNYNKTAEYVSSGGKAHFVLHLDTLLQAPTFRFLIFADWLGVYIPVGVPKILKVEPNKITTGTQNIYVQVQNLADVEDTFDVYIKCDKYIASSYNKVTIPPHQARWVALRVTASSNYQQSASCEVTAVNSLGTKSDSYKISIEVQPIAYCTPGDMKCNGNVIQKCNSAGTGWETVEVCSYSCKETASGPLCYSPKDSDGDGIPDDLDKCPNQYGYPIYDGCPKPPSQSKVTWLLIGILAVIVVYFVLTRILPEVVIRHYLGGGKR